MTRNETHLDRNAMANDIEKLTAELLALRTSALYQQQTINAILIALRKIEHNQENSNALIEKLTYLLKSSSD